MFEKVFGNPTINMPRINHQAVAISSACSVMIVGGTCSLSSHASCPTAECLSVQHGAATAQCPLISKQGLENAAGLLGQSAVSGLGPQYDFKPYFCSEQLSDVTLVVHDKIIPAHRLILAMSDKFQAMMSQTPMYRKPVERKWKVSLSMVNMACA